MIKILKRVSEYTLDDFKKYCNDNNLNYESYLPYFRLWAIEAHEYDLNKFIRLAGEKLVITVSGVICLDNEHHKVKSKTLPLKEAFEAMLTKDAQDFGITLSLSGKYYVYVIHSRGHNVFKFSLNDKN